MSRSTPVFVSILMPVRNEERWIVQSLQAVLNQDYPADSMEIILADGLSQDATMRLVGRLASVERVRIVANAGRTQAAGMNQMLRLARGEIIVRVDGHTEIAPDYVRRCVEALAGETFAGVGGALSMSGSTRTGQAIAAASRSPFYVPATFRVGSAATFTDTVYMGAWRRHVFNEIGCFDEALAVNEDYEFNYRLRRAGGCIYFTPAIRSTYHCRESLRALARQNFRYGCWKPLVIARHPASLRLRQLAAPAFVASVLIGSLLARSIPMAMAALLVMLASYGLSSTAFALRSRGDLPARIWLRIPFVFLTVHLTWGCGFWYGTLRLGWRHLRRNLP